MYQEPLLQTLRHVLRMVLLQWRCNIHYFRFRGWRTFVIVLTGAGCRLGEMSSQLVPDGVRVRLSSLSSSAAAASSAVNYSDVMSTDTCWRLCQCDGLLHDCTQQTCIQHRQCRLHDASVRRTYTYDLPHASIIYYSTVSVTCTVQPKITHVEIRVFFLVVDKIRFIHLEVIQY